MFAFQDVNQQPSIASLTFEGKSKIGDSIKFVHYNTLIMPDFDCFLDYTFDHVTLAVYVLSSHFSPCRE